MQEECSRWSNMTKLDIDGEKKLGESDRSNFLIRNLRSEFCIDTIPKCVEVGDRDDNFSLSFRRILVRYSYTERGVRDRIPVTSGAYFAGYYASDLHQSQSINS